MTHTYAEKILADLVSIPSISDNRMANEAALDYIEDNLRRQGMHIERLLYKETIGGREEQTYGALVATTTKTKTPKIMLSAHVDVVPGPEKIFKLRQKDGKLYGRGVADMKSAIASFMDVVRLFKESGELGDYDFGIAITTNEEIGGKGAENSLKDGFVPELAIVPDGGENWQIERIAKGAWNILVKATGATAHGSCPWDGDSASFRLLDFLGDVRKMFVGQGRETDTLNIARINSGQAQNQVPDSATAILDIRVMSADSQARLQTKMDKLCSAHGVSYELLAYFPPIKRDMNSKYINLFRKSIFSVRGKDEGDSISLASCDAVYYDKLGIPTIVVQPTLGGRHANDEWLERESLQQFTDVVAHFLRQTCRIR